MQDFIVPPHIISSNPKLVHITHYKISVAKILNVNIAHKNYFKALHAATYICVQVLWVTSINDDITLF